MKSRIRATALACAFLATITPLSADWRDEIGYTRLQLLAGPELPSAPSQGFTQVEASITNSPVYTFLPDTTSPLFTGKTFTNKSAATGTAISSHATAVATNFYGNTTSLVAGNCPIDTYYVGDWIGSTFLKLGSNSKPATEFRAVQNHSWIGNLSVNFTEANAAEANQRLDFAIDNDGFASVVGVDNDINKPLPALLCQSYHTISVGLVNGGHSAGFTTLDGTGRIKPDIVAPEGFTSFATPMVSSAAGLLYAKLSATPNSLTGADLPRVIKALLLATATKDTVASWSNTSSRPLDLRYGAGELNINHAYHALRAGRATASNSTLQKSRGWGAESVNGISTKTYYFTIPAGAPSTPFSAALTWHRMVTKTGFNTWNATLANLNLRLYQASGFTLVGPPIAESLSTVDNVELVHQATLLPGTYAVVVENTSTTATPYAIAWHSLPAVTVTATVATARESDLQAGLVTVSRTGDTTLPLFVPLTVGGSAVSGSHFQTLSASITIPAGQTSASLQVTPIADSIAQGDRSVSVGIANDFALVQDPAPAVVTIRDKPFDAWRFVNFTATQLGNPLISGDMADPDNDALANLIEYALGMDPGVSSVSQVITSQLGGYQTISASKNTSATDISWGAEVTGDLQTWQPAVVLTNNTTFQARDSVLTANASKRFIRLKVTRNSGP